MARRSRLEIYYDVLQVISRGAHKPTRIMYRANLSWIPLQEILKSLLIQGFIEEKRFKKSTRYEITTKGISVLNYYEKARELLTVEVLEPKR